MSVVSLSSKNKPAVSFKLNKNPTLQVKRAIPVKSQEKLHHVSEKSVDMKKVKLDVLKPWIAQRVTELRRSEDEEIANYICGLLIDKVVDRETIQGSIGKLLRDKTGTFMQELWTHLVSAQENASGIPQQFLDAKQEGTRKKQEDTDQITRELEDTEVTDENNGSKETARSNAPQSYQFLSPKPSVSPPRKKRIFRSPGEFVKPYIIPRSKANPYQQRTPSPAPRSPGRSWSPLHKTSTRQRLPSPERRSRSPLHKTSTRQRLPSPERRSRSLERRSSSRRRSPSWRSRSPAYVRRGLHSPGGRSPDQRRGQRDDKTRRGKEHEERRDTRQRGRENEERRDTRQRGRENEERRDTRQRGRENEERRDTRQRGRENEERRDTRQRGRENEEETQGKENRRHKEEGEKEERRDVKRH